MSKILRPTAKKRVLFFILTDILLSVFTLLFAYALRFNFNIEPRFLDNFFAVALLLIALKVAAMYYFRCYFIVWRFFGFEDAKNIIKAHVVAYSAFALIYLLLPDLFSPFPRSTIAIDLFLSLFAIGILRASKRLMLEQDSDQVQTQAIIYGANASTANIIKSSLESQIPYHIVAIIASADEHENIGSFIANIRVYDLSKAEQIIRDNSIHAAIITSSMAQKELKELADKLSGYGIRDIRLSRLLGSDNKKLEELKIEDLLARHPQDLDTPTIASFISNKRVAITGAGGSIGSEIARQCEAFGACSMLLIDHSEYNLYSIGEQIKNASLAMFSVVDRELLDNALSEFAPDIVIHAAAYKHVPLCEENQHIAIINNVIGSKNVIDSCIANSVPKLVIISTDKAVRPTSVMGATKRVAELYASNVDSMECEIVAVRFGNVLGSSGSVIPKFKQQIESGGPVTVTDERMVRYFMLIPEACQLVLQAASIAKGGELFILDMGEPVKIVDLAQQMIRLYAKEDEINIEFTGLRDGEKLYEELLLDESQKETTYSSIFVAQKTEYEIGRLQRDIEFLLHSPDKIEALKKIVSEFTHT